VFGSTKVKIDDALLAKIRKYAGMAGYSSPDEFITHALEKEIARIEEAQSEDEITKRLKGLGYLS
jgi:metal-responsive CopG/Arc/MetJ family transcriptional regulator